MKIGRNKQYLVRGLIGLVTLVIALAACSEGTPSITLDDLPPGDAARGAALFSRSINGSPPCSACHAERATTIGPTLVSYGVELRGRDSQNAFQYTLDAIIRPAKDVPRGYSNTMYQGYGNKLSPQEIADLIAFMLD